MGGNVTATRTDTGEKIKAQKVDLSKTGRKEFVKKFTEVFKKLNSIYKKKYKTALWLDSTKLDTNELLNGSTSYIFDQSIPDEELLKYKSKAGDLDILVPAESKENLWNLLRSLEGKEIIKGVMYHGSNKDSVKSIGEQMNCLFIAKFGEYTTYAQVDFEFATFDEEGAPNEIAKFGHSSNFEDAKNNIKALHHKYIIFAITGAMDVRDNIALATPASTPEKLKISTAVGSDVARMLKFDINKGVSVAYELFRDAQGNVIKHEGKDVYKQIPVSDRSFVSTVREIYKLCFQRLEGNEKDEAMFWSFVGILDLIKKYIKDKKKLKMIHDRYFAKLFSTQGQKGQVIEVGNPELDYQVKMPGYLRFCKEFGFTPDTKGVEAYYEMFPKLRGGTLRESFRDYLDSL